MNNEALFKRYGDSSVAIDGLHDVFEGSEGDWYQKVLELHGISTGIQKRMGLFCTHEVLAVKFKDKKRAEEILCQFCELPMEIRRKIIDDINRGRRVQQAMTLKDK